VENLTLEKGIFIAIFVLIAFTGLFVVFLRFLIREKRRCILMILYKANEPLRKADIIKRSRGALANGYVHGTLYELRVEGFVAEFQLHDDFQDGVQVTRYGITRYGKAYVEDCLPAPVA
jgi:hypothetical protein